MKAVQCPKYGSPEVLRVVDIKKPTPKNDEILIKIHATAVTNSDVFIRSAKIPARLQIPFRLAIGIRGPRKQVIGLVFAGEIESIGSQINRFKPGDKVYGLTGFGLGTYAEYKCMKENDSVNGCVSHMPENLTYEQATWAAYGGLLAFQFLEKAKLSMANGNTPPVEQQKVIIYGASSTTGTMAIQYAKYCGAEVTAICST